MFKDVLCFMNEDVGGKIESFGKTGLKINGNPIFINDGYGEIVNAHWNSDGALVVYDSNGNKHFFLGHNTEYIAYKGEDYPHDDYGYKKSLKECQEKRNAEINSKVKKKEEKKDKKSSEKKGPWWWRLIKWLFKGIFKFLGFTMILGMMGEKDNNK